MWPFIEVCDFVKDFIEIQITMYKMYFQYEPDYESKFQQDLFSKP